MTAASKWGGFPMLAFDTETSGVDVFGDRICTMALVELQPGRRPVVTSYVVDPGVEVPAEASAVNGYTRERLAAEATHTPEQMLFEAAGRIALWLGRGAPLLAMNAPFDLTLFEVECHRNRVDTLTSRLGVGKVSPVIDIAVLDKFVDPYRKGGRKLTQLCGVYGVRHTGAHEASADALAAARIWPRLMAAHLKKFPGQTLGGLHQAQVGWRKAQADGLRAYFDRTGTPHDGVDGGFPFRTDLRQRLASIPQIAPADEVVSR